MSPSLNPLVKGTLFSLVMSGGETSPHVITSVRMDKVYYSPWNGHYATGDTRRKMTKSTFLEQVALGNILVTRIPETRRGTPSVTRTPEECLGIFNHAHNMGMQAAKRTVPTPMVVTQNSNPWNNSSPALREYYEPQGVCGFAWIKVRPGNSSFARWLKETNRGRTDDYNGGVNIWVSVGNQSYDIKMAYARAFAEVLQNAGIQATPEGRVD